MSSSSTLGWRYQLLQWVNWALFQFIMGPVSSGQQEDGASYISDHVVHHFQDSRCSLLPPPATSFVLCLAPSGEVVLHLCIVVDLDLIVYMLANVNFLPPLRRVRRALVLVQLIHLHALWVSSYSWIEAIMVLVQPFFSS